MSSSEEVKNKLIEPQCQISDHPQEARVTGLEPSQTSSSHYTSQLFVNIASMNLQTVETGSSQPGIPGCHTTPAAAEVEGLRGVCDH